jgi:hypothetical protein
VGVGLFLIFLGVGAAANAIWFDSRFPSFAPRELKYGILHLAGAMLFGHTAVPLALDLAGHSINEILLAVFTVAFPALIYIFLAGFWMLRLAQGLLAGHLR